MTRTLHRLALATALTLAGAGTAQAAAVSFTKLTGVTGGSPANTAVFKADLATVGLSSILSITITDNSFGLGGSAGQFSGFDLDAIKLSTTDCASAACAAGLVGLSVFDYFAGVIFSPGVQRAPADPKLFGTNAAGTGVDNAVATLGDFDGDSTTVTPDGFLSMGDGGVISFNLTGAVSTAGLFLYIGEVGDNGELAAGNIIVRDTPTGVPVPVPATALLVALGLGGVAATRRRATA